LPLSLPNRVNSANFAMRDVDASGVLTPSEGEASVSHVADNRSSHVRALVSRAIA
jgi:hypothetical protein